LLPALSRAREKGRRVVCMSNERQILLGFRVVADECNGEFERPEFYTWFTNGTGRPGGPWLCPSTSQMTNRPTPWFGTAENTWGFDTWPPSNNGRPDRRIGSYALNICLIPRMWTPDVSVPRLGGYPWKFFYKESEISRSSLTPFLGDGVYTGASPSPTDLPPQDLYTADWPQPGNSPGNPITMWCIPRHGNRPYPVPRYWPRTQPLPGAINVVFYDGHDELVKLDNLWQLYWTKDWVPPARRPGLP
jgi:hypothetical protein